MTPALLALVLLAADPAPTGKLVDIGGRKLHVDCRGSGQKTIVLLNGLPRYSFDWALIQPAVAKFTRVCTYDRAGDAWSDPRPAGYDVNVMLDDLDKVLTHISPSKPVILAGHSFGGVLARTYAHKKPERVVSLMLIDSQHHNWSSIPIGNERKRMSELTREQAQLVADTAKEKFVAPKKVEAKIQPPFDKLPANVQPIHLWQMNRVMDGVTASDVELAIMTQWILYSGLRDVTFGDLPLIVLTKPEPEPWVRSQKDIAALSQKGRIIVVPNTGHDIELDNPQAIIDALKESVQPAK